MTSMPGGNHAQLTASEGDATGRGLARHRFMAQLSGAGMLLVGAALAVILPRTVPKLPEGFWTPIIAFEFARAPADVAGLFTRADGSLDPVLLDAMDLGNAVDYAFLLLYGGFLATTASLVAKEAGNKYRVAGALAIVAAGSDAFENGQLLAISRALRDGADYKTQLALLAQSTWTKWGCLVLALAWLSPWLFRASRVGKLAALLAWAAAGCFAAALVQRGALLECMSLCVTGSCVATWIVVMRWSPGARDAPQN